MPIDMRHIAGLVLAGGRSTRMGEDKTRKRLGHQPLALHAADRLRSQVSEVLFAASQDFSSALDVAVVADAMEGVQGPLSGILGGLDHVAIHLPGITHLAVVPADTPFFPADLVARLAEAASMRQTIAMAAYCGDPEPAFALWPVAIAGVLREWLANTERRAIRAFAETQDVRLVDFVDAPPTAFFNVNTPQQFATAEALLGRGPKPKILGIAGWKNSGKTGLTVRLVSELTARGYKVSTIKHAHHDFDIDKVGADSFRHREAGAHEVTVVSGTRFAIMHELRGAAEPSFQDILARLAPCDIVVIEGYKREPVPKIEARRLESKNREPLAPSDPHIVAIAADHATDGNGLPVFDLDDTQAIADFAERVTGLK